MKRFYFLSCISVISLIFSSNAIAQEQPDAGHTLQDLRRKPPSLPAPSPTITFDQTQSSQNNEGGPQVTLQSMAFHGNSAFSNEELLSLLNGSIGQNYDLAGLKNLADRITTYYHKNDYPFARALIPAQSIKGGKLHINIIEGRYGNVRVTNGDKRTAATQGFLHKLKTF